jgi:hypothetical protein
MPIEREDIFTPLREQEQRIDRLERSLRQLTTELQSLIQSHQLALVNSTAPATPAGGGAVYVSGGALHYIGSSGTNTTVASA